MPFRGLTVLDIASLAAAPQIAAFFGDFGARVIKVEPPGGDSLRRLVDARGQALTWKIVNRNKACVTLDLRKESGRGLFEKLLARADLLVCAHGRERLQRLGLNPEALRERHPRLVVVNLTAYGTDGPWAERGGSGTLAEAMAGLAALTGPADAPPTLSPVGLGDYLGVLQGIIAALVGLYQRKGEHLDVAMYEPVLGLLSLRIAAFVREGVEPGRHGNRFPTMAPRNTYQTSDGGWVALTAGTDDLVKRMFALLGRPELADDPRFRTNQERVENVEELDALIGAWIGARTRDEVVEAFQGAGVSLAAVDDLEQVTANPHFLARGSFVRVNDEELGQVTMAAPFPRRGEDAGRIEYLGRALGADNSAVYGDWLGLSENELEELRAAGVI